MDLGSPRSHIELAYAVVLAKLGRLDEAAAVSDRVLACFGELGIRGIHLARAHEALEAKDEVAFEEHAALAALKMRGARLRAALSARHAQQARSASRPDAVPQPDSLHTQLTSVFESCWTSRDRFQRGLELMVADSGAVSGFMYGFSGSTPRCCAVHGIATIDPTLEALAATYLDSQLQDEHETRATSDPDAATVFAPQWQGPDATCYVPVLLLHQVEGRLGVSGVAVLKITTTSRFSYPATLAAELSRLCHEKGDLSVFLL